MKKKLLAVLLTLCMVLTLLPVMAMAEDESTGTALGTVTALSGTATINSYYDNSMQVNVTQALYQTPITLDYVEANTSIGRMNDGWWLGIRVTAPSNAVIDSAKYLSGTSTDFSSTSAKSFKDYRDGDNYIGLWGLITKETLDSYFANGYPWLAYQWNFDWNGDNTNDQTIMLFLKVDQCTLIKDGEDITSVAKVGNIGYPTLAAAIAAASDTDAVELLKAVELVAPIEISKDVTIDLNDNTITGTDTRVFKVKSGTLTLTGTGTVTSVKPDNGTLSVDNSVIRVGNDNGTAAEAGLIIGENVTIDAPATYGVSVFGTTTSETVTVYGKIYSTAPENASYDGCAISTLGTDTTTPATVTIKEGAELTAVNTNAVYCPSGTLNIEGGTITGTCGVYFKSTNMTISGGTITGNGAKADYSYYGNGGISTGDALVVDNCNYPGGIDTISVTGGTFFSENASAVGSYNSNGEEALTGFISGGTFSDDPSEYVVAGYEAKRNADGNYIVAQEPIVVESGAYALRFETNGGSAIDTFNVKAGQTVDLSAYVPTRAGYDFAGWYLDKALTQAVTEVKMDDHTTVYAAWTENGSAPKFVDVPADAYYAAAVDWAVASGITTGVTETTFEPNTACTRAQMVTFLWRAAGEPEPATTESPFVDVAPDAYYAKAVLWGAENGIVKGTSETTFSPEKTVNRGQAVTFLYRYAGEPAVSGEMPFGDVAENAYYYDAVLWAVQNGVTTGRSATVFDPNGDCVRAEIVTFLFRSAK